MALHSGARRRSPAEDSALTQPAGAAASDLSGQCARSARGGLSHRGETLNILSFAEEAFRKGKLPEREQPAALVETRVLLPGRTGGHRSAQLSLPHLHSPTRLAFLFS